MKIEIESGRLPIDTEPIKKPLPVETLRLIEHVKKSGGYAVYEIPLESPNSLQDQERSILAFRPDPLNIFLRGSQGLPYEQQLERLEAEKAAVELRYRDSGIIVRVGKPTEWKRVASEHFKATEGRARIFGDQYGDTCTWADANIDIAASHRSSPGGSRRAIVGPWEENSGLKVYFGIPNSTDSRLGLAPILEIPHK